jgi:hypothetical protein
MGSVSGQTTNPNEVGVLGESSQFEGVRGLSHAGYHGGIVGINDNPSTAAGPWVFGTSKGTGVWGESQTWMGVYGKSTSTTGGAGVMGEGDPAPGVIGKSTKWIGVYGETAGIENGPAGVWGEHKGAGVGVKAVSKDGAGLAAYSTSYEAIHAETQSPETAAIAAYNLNPAGTGAALFAKKAGEHGHAGFFDGQVWITGALTVQGVNLLAALQQAQQRIATLEAVVQAMLPPLAHITVHQTSPAQGGVALFDIAGDGFRPTATIHLEVPGHSSAPNLQNTDSGGHLHVQPQIACAAGDTISITAYDPNHPKGSQASNTVTLTCL